MHQKFMQLAINEALEALKKNEVPIGAIITFNNNIIAKAHNLTETLQDPTAHAEMLAITAACQKLGAKYLKGATIYITLEPCPMCAAAIKWAQINNIVWAANDDKFGFSKIAPNIIHKKTTITTDICKDQSLEILQTFFKNLRK